ncbi:Uncharacterised protein [Bordetella pertussis]|nr:Uncharacterised protein [Bordetella pertussis]CFP03864.1 Uncharacterised protein [Bordetella pertussis]CFP25100.1 Uncharacterised protein [Bordetella pertussis]CFW55640.1 Uncharacterised protein [Bordetella pertussis]CPJ23002.1 Uncharacterised protein [Bordetella pertussis]
MQAETAGLEMVAAIGQPGLLAGFGVARHLHRQRLREGSQLAGPLDGQRGVADPDLDRAVLGLGPDVPVQVLDALGQAAGAQLGQVGLEAVPVGHVGGHVASQRETVDRVEAAARKQGVHAFAIGRGGRQGDEMRDIRRQPAHHAHRRVAGGHAQVDMLAEHRELARQVAVHLGQVLEARRIGNGAVLPTHEGVGATARDANADRVGGFAKDIAHFAHFGQQAGRVLVHRGIQLDHRSGDFGFDPIGDGMVGQLGQQLVRRGSQVKAAGIDQLQFELDTQGVGG